MLIRSLIILFALTVSAFGQQNQSPQMSILDQALSQKLLEEVNANIQLRTQLITAQDRIKQLEDAAKPKDNKK